MKLPFLSLAPLMQRIYIILIALFVAEMILALIAGPYSCEWGNTVYLVTGIAVLLVSVTLPFFQRLWTMQRRVGFSLLFLLASLLMWIVGLFAGDFRILCRLF